MSKGSKSGSDSKFFTTTKKGTAPHHHPRSHAAHFILNKPKPRAQARTTSSGRNSALRTGTRRRMPSRRCVFPRRSFDPARQSLTGTLGICPPQVIANMTVGKDVSMLFTDVVNCMQTGALLLLLNPPLPSTHRSRPDAQVTSS